MLVEARIYLGQLYSAFNGTILFTHQYYLPLTQSYQTIGSSTPERGAEFFQNSNATETVENTDEPGAGVFILPERTGRNPVTKEADKNEGSITMLKYNPKMAAMMYGHKKSNKTSVYSYHESLSLFDDQDCFNKAFRDPMELYKATSNKNGGATFERDVNNEVVEEMIEKIIFEVFMYEFKQ